MNTTNDRTHVIRPQQTYQEALLILGTILLRDNETTPWMSLRKISAQCRKHWAKIPRDDYSIAALTDWANRYFLTCGEIRGEELKVCYQTEKNDRMRMPQMQLRFVKLIPGGGVY